MSLIGGTIGYRLLRLIHPTSNTHFHTSQEAYETSREKLLTHFGAAIFELVKGRTVVDFGCGCGREVVQFAKEGAQRCIGVEIQERFRQQTRRHIQAEGLTDRCSVTDASSERADVVTSIDSFEHFRDPAEVLARMASMLNDEGEVWVSFGWPWYHPYGGHFFAVFPWAHLIFTEHSLCRWRADFKTDGATKFEEVEGGLNQMSIRRFEQLVSASPLEFVELRLKPIHPLRWIHCRWTREFTTGLIFARLRKKTKPHAAAADVSSG